MNKEENRIYSINKAVWLISQGAKYEICRDEERKNIVYFVFPKQDLSREIKEYYDNKDLQDFIKCFREIKKEMHEYMG